ncbi:urease subunit beta [Planosporangium mesophilum]|uniref:Urease subunit beta n=1 Tax=Planosporangium mesophilum TaxID=689768 RepID=A0A8J3TFM9_9ACTN|nr:urease subunit beta [Planosporangium mesophilum]NJC84556.1 urease subunit beta [Planosporangium mesophilum]GII23864.1 urease subunit beta [Planosporangium mesophilum]
MPETPSEAVPKLGEAPHYVPPGGYVLAAEPLELNAGREVVTIEVTNTGDRPVQVGSHFHFFEVNRVLAFDREAAFGMRLDIPAATSIRFEPGDRKTVGLVRFAGRQRVYGFNGLVQGWTGTGPRPGYQPHKPEAIARVAFRGFLMVPGEEGT